MNVESKVLAALSEDHYCSGQAISGKLNITRSAVWKHIVKLRERGYVIDARPRHGYRLASRPDKLLPAEIKPLLKTKVVGSLIVHLDETVSTADEARRLLEKGASEGAVVIADHQTGGRGRLGRSWQTPPGEAIALSVILNPSLSPTHVPLLSLATGLAVRRAVESVIGSNSALVLKWPNDVYLNGKKLAGVLVETAAELDRIRWAIDSIGLNVNNSFSGTALAETATSLATELGTKISRRNLLVALLQELDKAYARLQATDGLAAVRRDFVKYDMLQGRQVFVNTPAGEISGLVTGIDEEGRLLVQGRGKKTTALFSGEATLAGTGKGL